MEKKSAELNGVEKDLALMICKVSKMEGISLNDARLLLIQHMFNLGANLDDCPLMESLKRECLASNTWSVKLKKTSNLVEKLLNKKRKETDTIGTAPIMNVKLRSPIVKAPADFKSIQAGGIHGFDMKKHQFPKNESMKKYISSSSDELDSIDIKPSMLQVKMNTPEVVKKVDTVDALYGEYLELAGMAKERPVIIKGAKCLVAAQVFSLAASVIERYKPIYQKSLQADIESISLRLLRELKQDDLSKEILKWCQAHLNSIEDNDVASKKSRFEFIENSDTFLYKGVSARPHFIQKNSKGNIISVAVLMNTAVDIKRDITRSLQVLYCCIVACGALYGYLVVFNKKNIEGCDVKHQLLSANLEGTPHNGLSAKIEFRKENHAAFVKCILDPNFTVESASMKKLMEKANSK